MEVALYDAEVGYYTSPRTRVGRSTTADFYTAANLDAVFGRLVAAAVTGLLGAAEAAACEFVEIGAEPGRCVLDGVAHTFPAKRTLRLGEPLELHGNAVVFSNELFDAQPFHRVVCRDGAWRELGVTLTDGALAWTELREFSAPVARVASRLPAAAPENYVLDLPLAAEALAQEIASQSWRGLFIAFDYGRSWAELANEYPAGTGRAYSHHQQSGDLLAQPGEQDLTCHVCWDWLEEALRVNGFAAVTRESQEAFFVRRATAAIEQVFETNPDPLSAARSQLKHLLHPALFGQRFEVLWAKRVT